MKWLRILFPRGIGPEGKIPPEESPWAIFVGMKNNYFQDVGLSIVCLLALLMPMPASTQAQSGPPPVAAPLVREGDLAIRLGSGLGISMAADEIELRIANGATLREGQKRLQVIYDGRNQKTNSWGPHAVYGGSLCNNDVQGLARELLRRDAALAVESL